MSSELWAEMERHRMEPGDTATKRRVTIELDADGAWHAEMATRFSSFWFRNGTGSGNTAEDALNDLYKDVRS